MFCSLPAIAVREEISDVMATAEVSFAIRMKQLCFSSNFASSRRKATLRHLWREHCFDKAYVNDANELLLLSFPVLKTAAHILHFAGVSPTAPPIVPPGVTTGPPIVPPGVTTGPPVPPVPGTTLPPGVVTTVSASPPVPRTPPGTS